MKYTDKEITELLKEVQWQFDKFERPSAHNSKLMMIVIKQLQSKLKNNEVLDLVSGFSADKVEEAYRDGWNDRMIGTDTFHISNYR